MSELWPNIREELRRALGESEFDASFGSMRAQSATNGELQLTFADEMTALLVEKKYRRVVERCVASSGGPAFRISFAHGDTVAPAITAQMSLFDWNPQAPGTLSRQADASAAAQPSLHLENAAPNGNSRAAKGAPVDPRERAMAAGLLPDFDFDSFVVGSSNEFAWEAARAVGGRPGALYNPLFIYGGVGLGKTHLLNAIGLAALKRDPRTRIRYMSAETFMNELIEHIGARRMEDFRKRHRSDVDLLLVDDIQFIADKDKTQEEFFHTFNALQQSGRQIVVTCDRMPHEVPKLDDRLRSRLSMGLHVDIQTPDLETRLAILTRHAARMGFEMPSAVIQLIAENVRGNVRELHGFVLRVGTWARHHRRPISVEVVREQLGRLGADTAGTATPEILMRLVAEQFGVSVKDLRGRSRVARIALPRKVAMFLVRKHAGASYPELGEIFGGRDHTTVLSAVQSVASLIDANDPVVSRIDAVEKKLRLL
jgi:chromosomal replication initiator protein